MHAINVWGPSSDPYDSYGKLAIRLVEGLKCFGVMSSLTALDGRHDISKPFVPVPGGFLLGYPTNFKYFPMLSRLGSRIAITMFESTELPSGWIEELNACNSVITTSRWLVQVFRDAGVTAPIHVFPLGVDDIYSFKTREFSGKKKFLFINDGSNRKAWSKAFASFVKAFGSDENYELTIKSRPNQFPYRFENKNVNIIEQDLTEKEMLQLYYDHQFMICPTRGEGFGLLPREFAGTGGISIATGWGGTADDVEEWGIPIPYTLETAWSTHKRFKGKGSWANVDVDSLANILQNLASYSTNDLISKALYSSEFVHMNYNWNMFTKKCMTVFEAA